MAFGTIKADGILDSNGETLNIVDAVTNEAHSTAKGYMSAADKVKLDAIAAGAEVNSVTSVNGSTGAVTIQGFSTANNTKLDGIEAGAQVNAANTVVDANYVATDENFTTADHSKLDGIEAGAQVNAANTVIDASYVATDENFTTADHAKLDGVEAGATADQTKADIDALNINADLLDGQHGAYYTGYTDTAVSNLVDSSPATLNTLNELAAALGDDANFSTTVTNSIATKLPLAGGTLTGLLTVDGDAVRSDRTGSTQACFSARLNGVEQANISAGGTAVFNGNVTLQANLDMQDNDKILLGTGDDLEIYHDGSNSYIKNNTGMMRIQGTQFQVKDEDGNESLANFIPQGAVELFYDNSKKLDTKSDGVDITGELQCDSLDVDGVSNFSNDITLTDSTELRCGTDADLKVRHSGSTGVIENYTGHVYIDQQANDSDIILRSDNGSGGIANYIVCDGSSGQVKLLYYGNQKLNTTSGGVTVTGTAAATAFVGDGSGLTNLPAGGVSLGLAIALG